MKNLKKFLSISLAMMMAITMLAACGKKNNDTPTDGDVKTPTPTESNSGGAETPTPEVVEVVKDLKAMNVTVGNWWEADPAPEPKTQQEEDTLAYRTEIQEKYNFTLKVKNLGTWGEYQEIMITSTMSGAPAADVFVMDTGFIAAPLAQGLLYPLNIIENFDFTEEKWNSQVIEMMTFGENIYGMASGRMEPRLGVFFNKRLLEEAGIDPETPYNLQASGEWTWDAFKELLKQTTRDTNSDGVPDTYGLASFSVDFFKAVVFANGGQFIGKDATGKLYNATSEPQVLDALNWGRGLYDEGYVMPNPEGANWDWFIAAFKEGSVAFQAAEQYKVGTWSEMEDDWGFVIFPKGPAGEMMTVFNENIVVMPAGLDAEYAENVAFAYDVYTNPTPGYEDADFRTNYYPSFRDTRAVDETLPLFYEAAHGALNYMSLVDGASLGDIAYGLDGGTATPSEQIEKVASLWQTFIDTANGEAQ